MFFQSVECDQKQVGEEIALRADDRVWMSEFIEEVFLDGAMLYTLFGTKPMSGITICIATEEECIATCQHHLNTLSEVEKDKLLAEIHASCVNDTSYKNFQNWLDWKKNYKHPSFLFRATLSDCKHYLLVDMLNVQEAVWILKKHYEIFYTEIGSNFDPITAALDFENPKSMFWEKVFSNHYLTGILYGFGERNAYFFSIFVRQLNENVSKDSCLTLNSHLNILQDPCEVITKENLNIPCYRSFYSQLSEDPVTTNFKKEKVLIEDMLKDKDLTVEILRRIFGKQIISAEDNCKCTAQVSACLDVGLYDLLNAS